jgi:hypothetical protein
LWEVDQGVAKMHAAENRTALNSSLEMMCGTRNAGRPQISQLLGASGHREEHNELTFSPDKSWKLANSGIRSMHT